MTQRIIAFVYLVLFPSQVFAQLETEVEQFTSGGRFVFSTKGHRKSKGVNFEISYPVTWAAKEGERPNIVQKFVSERGKGLEMVLIQTKDLKIPKDVSFTNDDISEFFESDWSSVFSNSDMSIIYMTSTKIEGTPAAMVEYKMKGERLGLDATTHSIGLYFFQNRILVSVVCSTIDLINGNHIDSASFDAYRKLFFLILNSIVFPDKWK